jgi:hypothetical protein
LLALKIERGLTGDEERLLEEFKQLQN